MLFNFNNITYALGSDHVRQVVVSGSLNNGEVLVIRGPSGAGKSTLLRILARLQLCIGGEAFLQEKSWLHIPGTIWRSSVYYLAQKPVVFDGTVADNLAKPFEIRVNTKKILDINYAKDKMEELLLAGSLWEQDARTLSGGEAARLAFLRALLIDPKILLLDEPTAALDEVSRNAFYRVLSGWLAASDERAAILVSHYNDYSFLNNISFLDIKTEKG